MTQSHENLDALLRAAAATPIEEGSADLEAMVRVAAVAGPTRARRSRGRRRFAQAAVTLAAAAALVAGLVGRPASEQAQPPTSAAAAVPAARSNVVAAAPRPALSEWQLPAGDRIAVTAGSRWAVLQVQGQSRRLRLLGGVAVFDVATLGAASVFEVVTPTATVRVTGTVFGVNVGEGGTNVEVFEGSVEVRQAGTQTTLRAGEALQRSGPSDAFRSNELRRFVSIALARRRASAPQPPLCQRS